MNNAGKNSGVRSRIVLIVLCYAVLYFCVIILSPTSYFQFTFICIPSMVFLLLRNEIEKFRTGLFITSLIVFLILQWISSQGVAPSVPDSEFLHIARQFSDICIMAFLSFVFLTFSHRSNKYKKAIDEKAIRLQQKNKDMDHMAHLASHDLNEPIRTIKSFIQILNEENPTDNPETLQHYGFINEALTRMQNKINGLLNYSKIDQTGSKELTDIALLVSEVESDLSQLITEKKVKLTKKNLPVVFCMPLGLKLVFQNLITNAIKFQQVGARPEVKISCKSRVNEWEFRVQDNGIGIRPDKLKEVFRMFSKLHRKEVYPGQGIGLAFSKKIVEEHSGRIWVESTLGKGSTFYFTIKKVENPASK